jgi:hypothetical protein
VGRSRGRRTSMERSDSSRGRGSTVVVTWTVWEMLVGAGVAGAWSAGCEICWEWLGQAEKRQRRASAHTFFIGGFTEGSNRECEGGARVVF